MRWPVSAGTKEPAVVLGVDVMSLHHPHQVHRISAAGKAAAELRQVSLAGSVTFVNIFLDSVVLRFRTT
jgi:hypothetical protein